MARPIGLVLTISCNFMNSSSLASFNSSTMLFGGLKPGISSPEGEKASGMGKDGGAGGSGTLAGSALGDSGLLWEDILGEEGSCVLEGSGLLGGVGGLGPESFTFGVGDDSLD